MRDIGVQAYRFSISWSRVLPTGTLDGGVSDAGFKFYEDLCAELVAAGIEPVCTLYHWDLPQALEDRGGWLNRSVVEDFRKYAELCFSRLGRYVKTWCTINEPWTQCLLGYVLGSHAPGRSVDPGREPYIAGHHMLLAHASAVQAFRAVRTPGQLIAMVLNTEWYEPQEPNNPADIAASDRALAFCLGWFADPLYKGDYPSVMREICGERLPQFTPEERATLLNSNDFFALNNYSARYICEFTAWRNLLNLPATFRILPYMSDVVMEKVNASVAASRAEEEAAKNGSAAGAPVAKAAEEAAGAAGRGGKRFGGPASAEGLPTNSYTSDENYLTAIPMDAELTATGWPVAHYGLGRLLQHLQKTYAPKGGIIVTEGGAAFNEESGQPPPEQRQAEYLKRQALVLRRAITEGVDVRGYFWWTLMDNFEWSSGYSKRFGLYSIDFAPGSSLARVPRPAAAVFKELAARTRVSEDLSLSDFEKCLQRPDGL